MAKKILVIDDDPVGGKLLALRNLPDLIILDIEMPEMNGYTFVMELKKLEPVKATPVIVLTSHEENRAIFARKGISHYLVKPVNFDVLFAKMKELAV